MIGINAFSAVDLLAVIISTHVMLVFAYRTIRVTRRGVDRLFTGVTILVCLQGLFVLSSDNVVPTGTAADAVPGAAARTLLWYRLMYVAGTLHLAALTHFVLRYTQSPHLRGRRAAWLYAGALVLLPLYFTDGFLLARATPLHPTSSWWCAVPWQPESGPWSAVFVVVWLGANGWIQWMLWRRPRRALRGGAFDQRYFVWSGITLWGVAGVVAMTLAAIGYAGVDPSMFLVAGAMVVLAIGLAEDHLHAETQSEFITQVFGRYVTADVVTEILDNPRGLELGGARRTVSVMLSDLRGFTALAERLSPEQVVELLNIYLGVMADVITEHRGTINEFIGDGILAIFGAPIRHDDFAESAVRCALAMQLAMPKVNARIAHLGIPPLEMGIGIHTGEVIIGNIGSAKRAKYGAIGANVNLAARIESASVGGQILVSQSTGNALAGRLEIRRELILQPKGAREPMVVFDVVAINGDSPLRLLTVEENWAVLDGQVALECTHVSDEKQIVGPAFAARVIAIGHSIAQLETDQPLDVGANLRMRFTTRQSTARVLDFYGKVISAELEATHCVVRFTSVPAEAWRIDGNTPDNLAAVMREIGKA